MAAVLSKEDVSKNEPGLLSKSNLHSQKSKSRRHYSSDFDIIVKPDSPSAKLTIAVSKKVAGRAVDRNRIKRIIKEALRAIGRFDNPLTVIVKKNIAGLKSYQVTEKLKRTLLKSS